MSILLPIGGTRANEMIETVTITSGGYQLLSDNYKYVNVVVSSGNDVVFLPDMTGVDAGWQVYLLNDSNSSDPLLVKDYDSNSILSLEVGKYVNLVSTDASTQAGTWRIMYQESTPVAKAFSAYSSAGGDSVGASASDLSYDSNSYSSNVATKESGNVEFTINESGTYELTLDFSIGITSGSTGGVCEAFVVKSAGGVGSYTEITGSRTINNVSAIVSRANTSSGSIVVNLSASDKIKVQAIRTVSTSTFVTTSNSNRLSLKKL